MNTTDPREIARRIVAWHESDPSAVYSDVFTEEEVVSLARALLATPPSIGEISDTIRHQPPVQIVSLPMEFVRPGPSDEAHIAAAAAASGRYPNGFTVCVEGGRVLVKPIPPEVAPVHPTFTPDTTTTPKGPLADFTDRSRKVLQLAKQAAKEWGHAYIGTEHLLFGLAKEPSGVATNVLRNLGVTADMIEAEVKAILGNLIRDPRPTAQTDPTLAEAIAGGWISGDVDGVPISVTAAGNRLVMRPTTAEQRGTPPPDRVS